MDLTFNAEERANGIRAISIFQLPSNGSFGSLIRSARNVG